MLIIVSLALDITLGAPLVMQGTVPILAATWEDELAAGLTPFFQLLLLVPDGFSAPGSWILPHSPPQECLKFRGRIFLLALTAEPSAAIPAPGGMQVVDSSL